MKGSGEMINLKDKEFIRIKLEMNIRENGKMVKNKEMELKSGLIKMYIMDSG